MKIKVDPSNNPNANHCILLLPETKRELRLLDEMSRLGFEPMGQLFWSGYKPLGMAVRFIAKMIVQPEERRTMTKADIKKYREDRKKRLAAERQEVRDFKRKFATARKPSARKEPRHE